MNIRTCFYKSLTMTVDRTFHTNAESDNSEDNRVTPRCAIFVSSLHCTGKNRVLQIQLVIRKIIIRYGRWNYYKFWYYILCAIFLCHVLCNLDRSLSILRLATWQYGGPVVLLRWIWITDSKMQIAEKGHLVQKNKIDFFIIKGLYNIINKAT